MDLQSRKIAFVQEFLKIQHEDLVGKFEEILRIELRSGSVRKDKKPMSIEELNRRIDESMNDSENERLIASDKLKDVIKGWG